MTETCNNLERVSAYHDGELPDAAAAEVERHLAACGECAAELERFRAMSRQFDLVELPRLSNSARRRLHRAIEDERSVGRLRIVRALTAIAASVFLVAGVQVMRMQAGPGGGGPEQPASSRVLFEMSPVDRAAIDATGRSAAGSQPAAEGNVVLPADVAPQKSFAQDMVDGLESRHD